MQDPVSHSDMSGSAPNRWQSISSFQGRLSSTSTLQSGLDPRGGLALTWHSFNTNTAWTILNTSSRLSRAPKHKHLKKETPSVWYLTPIFTIDLFRVGPVLSFFSSSFVTWHLVYTSFRPVKVRGHLAKKSCNVDCLCSFASYGLEESTRTQGLQTKSFRLERMRHPY
jgi:hypothetical protein